MPLSYQPLLMQRYICARAQALETSSAGERSQEGTWQCQEETHQNLCCHLLCFSESGPLRTATLLYLTSEVKAHIYTRVKLLGPKQHNSPDCAGHLYRPRLHLH